MRKAMAERPAIDPADSPYTAKPIPSRTSDQARVLFT
jgi:hypothetical protein